MVCGETGRSPLSVNIYTRIKPYWKKLFSGPEIKIVHILYKYFLTQYNNDIFKNPLNDCMLYFLITVGFQTFGINNVL